MINPLTPIDSLSAAAGTSSPSVPSQLTAASGANTPGQKKDVKQAFDQFVGETFYSQMLQSLHKMAGKPAFFHGGRAEEVFQGQLDQVLSQKMTEATPGQFSGSMFELFNLQRKP